MGVSFMQEIGQSNVRRMIECNSEGQFELEENGHRGGGRHYLRNTVLFKGIITAIECIVATTHEEL